MRLLIVQIADIGDLVLSTPALAALRERHPGAHITLLTTPHAAPVVTGIGLVDETLTLPRTIIRRRTMLADARRFLTLLWSLRRTQFDAVVFLHHLTTQAGVWKYALMGYAASRRRIGLENGRGFFLTERIADEGFGAKHEVQHWLDLAALLGADPSPRPSRVAVSAEDRAWAEAALPAARPRVIIHAGSGGYSAARRWDAASFAAVADALAERGAQIILVGGEGDDSPAVRAQMRQPALDLAGKTTLGQLAAVLEQVDLFIGADSGVMHIACAAGTPVIALYGPSNAAAWGPWTPRGKSIILRSAPECSPCSYVDYRVGAREGCIARTCMRMITPRQVVIAAERALNGEMPPSVQPLQPEIHRTAPHVTILGLPVSRVTYDEWLALIERWVAESGPPRHVCTINPEMVMIAQRDSIFRGILRRAALTVPDGVGLLWAARRLGQPLPERVTGSDGVPRIAERAAHKGWRLFLLGAAEGVAEKAAAALRARYPGVQITGVYAGSPAPEEEDEIVARINRSGADILFVAYGAPEQDKWIARNLPRLKVHMAMGVGGSFDFLAGVVPRAPQWMRRFGLEWLFRLYLQPWRIWRMMRLPRFVLAVLRFGARPPDAPKRAAIEGL